MDKKHTQLAEKIISYVGGKDNIAHAYHCITRVRLNLKDNGLIDMESLKQLDVAGVVFVGEQLQIVIGAEVNEVYDAVIARSGLEGQECIEENLDGVSGKKRSFKDYVSAVVDGIVGCVSPILPILIGSGLLKAIIAIAQNFGVAADSPTLNTLSFVSDAAFYFLPVFLGGFAAKKFKANTALGMMLGAAMLHPTFQAMVAEGSGGSVFGLPIYATNYASTVVPIILSVWVMSYVERFVAKHSPKALRTILEPLVTLLVMIPVTFCALAPLGAMMSDGFAGILNAFYDTCGFIALPVLAAFIPFIIMVGLHAGVGPFIMAAFAANGFDPFIMPAFFVSNFAQGAACLAVGVKAKDAKLKSFAYSSAFSNIVPGISEPGMYGVTLRYKTPMYGAMIGAVAGGLYFGIMKVVDYVYMAPNIFAFTGYINDGSNLLHAIIGVIITLIVGFAATMVLYKPEEGGEKE